MTRAGLHGASNASAPTYSENDLPIHKERAALDSRGFPSHVKVISASQENDSTSSLTSETPAASASIAIFCQYLTTTLTTFTMREDGVPSLPNSFTITNGADPIFTIHRQRPSLFSQRQVLIDAKSFPPVMTVRRNVGTLPTSSSFVDPSNERVFHLQGYFSIPHSGSKSSALLINGETGQKIELALRGSYRNHKGTITNKETGSWLR